MESQNSSEVKTGNETQEHKLNRFSNLLLLVAIIFLIFGGGYRLGESRARKTAQTVENTGNQAGAPLRVEEYQKEADLELFWQVWRLIKTKYADQSKVKSQEMIYGAIKGMVASLGDPYSYFLSPKENQQSKNDLGGKYEGIGAELGMKENRIIVVAPLDNSPAKRAGIMPQDYILAVDGKPTKGWTITQAVNSIRGEGGTTVKLTLLRGSKEFEVSLKREQIKVDSVKLSFQKSKDCKTNCSQSAVLKVTQFGDSTASEWDRAVVEIQKRWNQGTVKGLVVDMRSNPGGYLDGAVYLASEFLPVNSLIVKQEYADRPALEYKVTRQGKLLEIPLVVLINEGSASAAEIFAGALRDHDRAELVGKKSFGKGSIQEALDLTDNTGLHLTIAKWILPDGDWINSKGIEPDTEVEIELKEGNTLEDATDAQLQRALKILVQ